MLILLATLANAATVHVEVRTPHHPHHHHERPARTGLVQVDNDTGRWIDLYADGDWVASIAPGTRHVQLPLGSTSLEASVDGYLVQRGVVTVSAGREATFRVVAPRTGRVVIDNDGRSDLHVYVDGEWTSTVYGNEALTLDLRPGSYRIDLVDDRGHGGTVSSQVVTVDRYHAVQLEVDDHPSHHARPQSKPSKKPKSSNGHHHGHSTRR